MALKFVYCVSQLLSRLLMMQLISSISIVLLFGSRFTLSASIYPLISEQVNHQFDDGAPIEPFAVIPQSYWLRALQLDQNEVVDVPLELSQARGEDGAAGGGLNETMSHALNSANCGIKNGPNFGLVVGGQEAAPNSWPWAVAVLRDGTYNCGGSILSERYILTAAHCVSRNGQTSPPTDFQILVGAHDIRRDGDILSVQRVIPHEDYDERTMLNDIALIRLTSPIDFSDKARPICLPTAAVARQNLVSKMSTIVGWGYTREDGQVSATLQQVQIPIISNQQCARMNNLKQIRDGQICAAYPRGGRDSCQGDSGGSMTLPDGDGGGRYYQIGVVSWGDGCARANSPGVYTRVSKYVDWIARNTRL